MFVNVKDDTDTVVQDGSKLKLHVVHIHIFTKFLQIYISQGSVATQLRCGGMFSNQFITNFPQNVPVKNCENRSIFGQKTFRHFIYGQKLVAYFFGPPCIYST